MDGQQFDKLTRSLAAGFNRRSLLKLLGGGTLAVAAAPAILRVEHAAAQGGGPGDPCAPGTLPCADGLLCAAEQEGVCYCEDPANPWLGCACTGGIQDPCGDSGYECCGATVDDESGSCRSACDAVDNSCISGTEGACDAYNAENGTEYICCNYGGAEGSPGTCVAQDACVVEPPNTGAGTMAETSTWIAPAAALGAAAAVIAYKGRERKADTEA